MDSLVSVVMPAFNGEKFISQAIESVIEQTYKNWELIIVDDASEDETKNIVLGYNDSRIKVYSNKTNMGISFSTNKAIQVSLGDYIALLDDDDMATKDRLLLQVDYLNQNMEIDILGGRSVCIDENGKFIMHDTTTPLYNPKMIKAWMHFSNRRFSNGTTMIRKSFIEKNGLQFKEDYYGLQDFKFMADSSKVGNISSIDRILQIKRIHPQEATTIYLKNKYSKRKEKYAQLQRESLYDSGFRLTEEQLHIINYYLPEESSKILSKKETLTLINVFNEIIIQAKKMKIDYLTELQKVCRNIIIERSIRGLDFDQLVKLYVGE